MPAGAAAPAVISMWACFPLCSRCLQVLIEDMAARDIRVVLVNQVRACGGQQLGGKHGLSSGTTAANKWSRHKWQQPPNSPAHAVHVGQPVSSPPCPALPSSLPNLPTHPTVPPAAVGARAACAGQPRHRRSPCGGPPPAAPHALWLPQVFDPSGEPAAAGGPGGGRWAAVGGGCSCNTCATRSKAADCSGWDRG